MFKMGDFGLNYKLNQFELVYFGFKLTQAGFNRFETIRIVEKTG